MLIKWKSDFRTYTTVHLGPVSSEVLASAKILMYCC